MLPLSTLVEAAQEKSPYRPNSMPKNGKNRHTALGGIDKLKVRRTNAGNLIRFSYRVVDAERAKAVTDKQAKPYLISPRSRAVLQVPVMDKVGQLRQSGPPREGQEYWMVFSNKGDVVKAGERVTVIIGAYRFDGLLVE